jgi:PTH1 family peptidyl-tRNA hydrolase
MKLIFAQGNPGLKYARTRHNTGFMLLEKFAEGHEGLWQDNDKFKARIATVTFDGEKALLVMPLTFYNETGMVARSLIDYYKLDPATDFLAIHDDLSLPLGTIRVREKGSAAGNNGVKSLNTYVGENYQRIRVGIWTQERNQMDDVNFVLGTFTAHEHKTIMKQYDTIEKLIHAFFSGTLDNQSISLT